MEGAALATLISFFIYIILLWQEGKKIYNFKIFSGLIKSAIAALIMGVFVYILEIIGVYIIINIIVSSLLYFTLLYLFKEKLLEEILAIIKQ